MTPENHNIIDNKESLIAHLARGKRVKYVFFWGHQKPVNGVVGKSCFSQWYQAAFDLDGIHYPSAEHYMMAEKARLFNDDEALKKILQCQHPAQAKKLGRAVKGYQETRWKQHRFDIVVRGNVAKFSQHDDLKQFLLYTGNRVLVEASPVDRIWGIGMDESDPYIENPAYWKGLNLLGFALMAARQQILNMNY